MPSASSSSWLLGLRSSGPPGTTTIGRSPTGTSSSRSIASASGDPSSSSHLDASRLRARTSSSRRVPASNRDPIRVRPEPSPVRIECRSKNVRRISSLRPELLRHQHPHLPGGNAQHPPGRARHRAQEYALPGQQADLAKELRRAIRRDNRLARLAAALDDPDLTGQHHDQVITHIPVCKQHFSCGNVHAPCRTCAAPQAAPRPGPGHARPGSAAQNPCCPRRRGAEKTRVRRGPLGRSHAASSRSGHLRTRRTAAGPWQEPVCQPDTRASGHSDCTCPGWSPLCTAVATLGLQPVVRVLVRPG